jgi:hypothetical protein
LTPIALSLAICAAASARSTTGGRLGDLQNELARRQATSLQRPADLPLEFRAAQPRRADVDMQDQVDAGGLELAAGEIQHHGVESGAKTGGFRRGDECVGLDVGSVGRGPPRSASTATGVVSGRRTTGWYARLKPTGMPPLALRSAVGKSVETPSDGR